MKLKLKSKEIVGNIDQFFDPDVSKTLEQCGLGYIKVRPSHKAEKTKLHEAYLWLADFSKQILEYQAVRSLHPETTWANFLGMFKKEMADAEEVVQLNLKKEQLVRTWKQRPGVLRKTTDARV